MTFVKLRIVVTVTQLVAVVLAAVVALNIVPSSAGHSFRTFGTTEETFLAQGSLVLLWMVQLYLLWNPSEFTSNKNLFRPASIGKSSVIILIAIAILAAVEESLVFFGYGVFFVVLGSTLLLVGYIALRHSLRVLKHAMWLPRRPIVLVDNKEQGTPLGDNSMSIPAIEVDDNHGSSVTARLRTPDHSPPGSGQEVELVQHMKDMGITAAFLSGRNKWRSETLGSTISANQDEGIDSVIFTQLGPEAAEKVDILLLENDTAILVRSPRRKTGYLVLKRVIDVTVSSLLLIVLSPLMLLIGAIIRLESSGPAIFRSERLGQDGKQFTIFKFRSMRNEASLDHEARYVEREEYRNGVLFKEPNDDRITRFGAILRRTSADELPQLWNVLKGEMSLVGPRPHMELEMAGLPAKELRRLNVKPGITGLWQVNGRSELPWDEAVKLDLLYVANQSMWLDLTILLRTIPAVLSARGAF